MQGPAAERDGAGQPGLGIAGIGRQNPATRLPAKGMTIINNSDVSSILRAAAHLKIGNHCLISPIMVDLGAFGKALIG